LSKLLENPFGILKNGQQNEFNTLLCIFKDLPKTFSLHQGKSTSNRIGLRELYRSYLQT